VRLALDYALRVDRGLRRCSSVRERLMNTALMIEEAASPGRTGENRWDTT
jgi:hypothetical protein